MKNFFHYNATVLFVILFLGTGFNSFAQHGDLAMVSIEKMEVIATVDPPAEETKMEEKAPKKAQQLSAPSYLNRSKKVGYTPSRNLKAEMMSPKNNGFKMGKKLQLTGYRAKDTSQSSGIALKLTF